MSGHTPEPRSIDSGSYKTLPLVDIIDAEGAFVCAVDARALDRIVHSVNACAGLNPEALPGLVASVTRVVNDAADMGGGVLIEPHLFNDLCDALRKVGGS